MPATAQPSCRARLASWVVLSKHQAAALLRVSSLYPCRVPACAALLVCSKAQGLLRDEGLQVRANQPLPAAGYPRQRPDWLMSVQLAPSQSARRTESLMSRVLMKWQHHHPRMRLHLALLAPAPLPRPRRTTP
jgi:hypothetical protein